MSACVREPELEAALDGRLDADATRQVLAHASHCLRCREARAELQQLSRMARALAPEAPDELRARRVRGAVLSAALMGVAPPRRRRVSAAMAGAMAATLGLAAVCYAALGAQWTPRAVRHERPIEHVVRVSPPLQEPVRAAVPRVEAPTVAPTVAPTAAPSRAPTPVDPGAWFREGSFAYARGDHADAERALGRFLSSAPRSDPRREDARYLRVLSLYALARTDALVREAESYGREFPRGLKRPEVVLAAVRALAADHRCDAAQRLGASMPDDAPAPLRAGLARSLDGCR